MKHLISIATSCLVSFGVGLVASHNPNQQTNPQWWVPLMFVAGWALRGAVESSRKQQ